MKNRNLKKWILIAIGVILLLAAALVIVKVIHNKSNQEEVFEPEWGPLKDGEGNALGEKLEQTISLDGEYPDYYGGCYLKKQNLIICLTQGAEDKESEVREIVGQNEGVYIRYVKHSLNDLEKTQQEFGERYQELYEEGDQSIIQLLNDITGSGVYIEENEVGVKIKNYSWWKARKFKKLFGENGIIRYTEGGQNSW